MWGGFSEAVDGMRVQIHQIHKYSINDRRFHVSFFYDYRIILLGIYLSARLCTMSKVNMISRFGEYC